MIGKKSFFKTKRVAKRKGFLKLAEKSRVRERGKVYSSEDASALIITAESDGKSITFTTRGRWISLNDIISKAHYMSEKEIKKIVTQKVRDSVKDINIKIKFFRIILRYNAKLDDHNTVMMPKYFTDAIKFSYLKIGGRYVIDQNSEDPKKRAIEYDGIIIDDDKRYSKGTFLIPDESLPVNTFLLTYQSVEKNYSPEKILKNINEGG